MISTTRMMMLAAGLGLALGTTEASGEGYRTYYADSEHYAERYPDGWWRASDGERFQTDWERDAYQDRLDENRARLRREEAARVEPAGDDKWNDRMTEEERAVRKTRREARARAEADRERLEAEARERDRLAAEERERERLAAEERERLAAEERERIAAEERERLAAEERGRPATDGRDRSRRDAPGRGTAPSREDTSMTPLPEGWSVTRKDGQIMAYDTEGRLRSLDAATRRWIEANGM